MTTQLADADFAKTDGVSPGPTAREGVDPAFWDGRIHSYRPAHDWLGRVASKLELDSDAVAELDPITFEVIRNRLWTINLAHGETLTRISGSPVFQALDFNMCIMTERGEIAMNAPYLQCLVAGAPLAIRFIMEKFSADPGIEDGDIFLATDPWIGAVHQMDVLIASPVFIDGRLFAWVTNAGHQYDRGGITPGGWPQNAPDVYSDPTIFRPFKIVERGVVRRDLEEMYLRQSRVPDLLALDLRAQIAGCRFAVQQMRELCDQFGPDVVKATMRRVLDNAQLSMQDKLRRIPDGRWSEVRYFDELMPGHRDTYRMQVNITKEGDRIIIDNEGTDRQVSGPLNFVYAAFSGQFLGVVAVTMLYEQMFSIGGAERQIDFCPTPGLLTCADYPAAVSGGVQNVVIHTNAFMNVIARMLACDPELKSDVLASGAGFPLLVLAGSDDRGNYFGTGLMDAVSTGSGGRSTRDGVDTGGATWSPLMKMINVEDTEQFYPILYLYRQELEDSGGAGRYRGGVGMKFAFTPYRAREISAITNTGGQIASTFSAMGLFGGLPSPTCHNIVRKGTNLTEMFAARRMPAAIAELSSTQDILLRGKSNGTPLEPGDVMESTFCGGGGYGDPLLREAEMVARDVLLGYVSVDVARDVYGTVLRADGAPDVAATRSLRSAIRAERSRWRPAGATSDCERRPNGFTRATGAPPASVHEYIVARDEGDQRVLACAHCSHVLSDYAGNYKEGLLEHSGPVTQIPGVKDPVVFLDEEMRFRRYCCPGCQTLMTMDVVRADEPVLCDMRLTEPGAA
ncbi:hydantoinase B/oxoprolinase family protein [Flavisphingomonas formosensis]|uniref:hydantoinase B/oxoprolinase family protein n=1 Tax=Flavisphingomonas formosensis TaxID=861534 RepID=UPI0018E01410|nr:hydantoinase B/oxoprolinase family protein [Sphingomonas formosensis]